MAFLDEAPDVAPELVARVRSAAAAEASERDGLSRLARVHDQHTGLRARQVFFILLGLSWTASQFADRYGPLTHRRFALSSLVELPLLGLAWLISRDMMRTLFNRRMLGAVALMLVAQSIFFLCADALDVPIVTARTLQLGLWATVAASLTLFLARRFWPMTLCMVCALATTVRWPDHRAVAGAVSSAAVTVNLAMMWRRKPSR